MRLTTDITKFKGALRLHDENDNSWQKQWGGQFGVLMPNLRFIASDAFGVMFGLDADNKMAIFWPETGDIEHLGITREEFFEDIENSPNETVNLDLYLDAVKKLGQIDATQNFAFVVVTALGGAISVDNLRIMGQVERMRELGFIAQQIHDDPVGTKYTRVEMER